VEQSRVHPGSQFPFQKIKWREDGQPLCLRRSSCCNEVPPCGRLTKATEVYFSWLGGWKSKVRCQHSWVLWGLFQAAHCCLLPMLGRRGALSEVLFRRSLIPPTGLPSRGLTTSHGPRFQDPRCERKHFNIGLLGDTIFHPWHPIS
jgi:hypothetical protein